MKIMTKGFTLIELLVVISIMAIVGTFTVANFRSFGEDKELANAALDIQSLLRTAQTNASANVKCPNGFTPKNWLVNFISSQRIDLDCADSTGGVSSVKSLALGSNIQLGSIVNDSPMVPPPACPKFSNQTSQDCRVYPTDALSSGTYYVKCEQIPGFSNMDCSVGNCSWAANGLPYYSDSAGTNSLGAFTTGATSCSGGTPVTLKLTGGSSGGPCTSPVKFNFAPLTGAFASDCGNSSTMEVGVQNAKGSVKLVKVTAGNISITEGVAVSPLPTASSAPTPTPSPSPSPSPSTAPGCPGFKYSGTVVSSQTCKNTFIGGGSYYVKCSEITGILDCDTSSCNINQGFNVYDNPDGTGSHYTGWVNGRWCGNGASINLTVIP